VAAPAPVAVRSPENQDEERIIHTNRRRAHTACLIPALVVGVVVGAVLAAVGLPLEGIAALVLLTALLFWWGWRGATPSVLRSLGARPSQEEERPRLHNLVDGLCATMGLPSPAILVVENARPNALAVGRDPRSASLVVTSGLDDALSLVELEGVLAHELVHVKRHDTLLAGVAVRVMTPVAALVGTERGADYVHRLVGPGREFSADQRAASVVHYPTGLSSALRTMAGAEGISTPWGPGVSRVAGLTRWLWIDPGDAGSRTPADGELDDPEVRAAALSLL
jgi:Zn-dependent protease with chaperone function